MDVLPRMLLGSRRWDVAQRDLPRLESNQRSDPASQSRKEQWRHGRWCSLFSGVVTLTVPLIALMLSAGCSALPRPVSELRFVATTPNATAAELPADGSGQYWKREQSREIKLGPAWIVQIIERAGPLDEELHRGRRVAVTEFNVEIVDVLFQNPFGHPTMIKSSSAPMPAPTLPVLPGREPSGVGPGGQTPMSTGDQINLSQALQNAFQEYSTGQRPDHRAATGRHRVRRLREVKAQPFGPLVVGTFLKPVSTDTGVVLRTHTVPAPGLGVATCGAAALASAEEEIMRDGRRCRDGRKTSRRHRSQEGRWQQNSIIRWTAAGSPIVLTAQERRVGR